ncbi:MAG: TIGR01777 family protein [Bacteroidia bacterium]|nr:TIGR01777 family protein [Bacteroidia bacterium]
MQKNVLISGGTGTIGHHLTQKLLAQGYQVSYLSRRAENYPNVKVYQWDIEKNYLEPGALEQADYLIHLAGAGIADKTWTEERKTLIRESRVHSGVLLAEKIQSLAKKPQAVVAASAIGFYGFDTGSTLMQEDSPAGQDFLADITHAWEKASDQIAAQGIRMVKFRIGIVLSPEGGALPKLTEPIKYGVGAALGSGDQYLSWIHVEDLCRMFVFALENENLEGVFNAVAPHPVTNATLTKVAARVLKRPLWLPNVPALALHIMLGDRAKLVLGGSKVSSEKIEATGFSFEYPYIEPAVENLFNE